MQRAIQRVVPDAIRIRRLPTESAQALPAAAPLSAEAAVFRFGDGGCSFRFGDGGTLFRFGDGGVCFQHERAIRR